MKNLSVQFQPDLQPSIDFDVKASELERLARKLPFVDQVSVDSGSNDGRYINVDIQTSDVTVLWPWVQDYLGLKSEKRPLISEAVIVVCEGEDDWNDYLLLHHFDATQETDNLVAPSNGPGST